MPHTVSSRQAAFISLVTVLMLVLTGFVGSGKSVSAQAVPDCSNVVANGGFENPTTLAPDEVLNGADSWGGDYVLYSFGLPRTGNQHVLLRSGLVQMLNTTGLGAGDTITISIWYDQRVNVSLGSSTVTSTDSPSYIWANVSISYTLLSPEESVSLSITKGPGAPAPYVDDVTASCVAADPVVANDQVIDVAYEGTFSGTLTASGGVNALKYDVAGSAAKGSISLNPDGSFTYFANPGLSGSDIFTFSATDSVLGDLTDIGTVTINIAAPEPEPTPEPSPTSEADPVPDTQLSVTADPRFPISGSAAIDGYDDLTYALGTAPTNGSVDIDADGTFRYTANNIWLVGDQFTVIATAPDGEAAVITVRIVYAIDKTVPTQGEVKPGGSDGGGDSGNDAREGGVSQPEPTTAPSDDDGGRVDRP